MRDISKYRQNLAKVTLTQDQEIMTSFFLTKKRERRQKRLLKKKASHNQFLKIIFATQHPCTSHKLIFTNKKNISLFLEEK